MTLSLRDVREKLGFKPVKVFREERRQRLHKMAADSPHLTAAGKKELLSRQMGKTTEMLLKAVHAASKGHPVLINSANPHIRQCMREDARRFCARLHINPKLILLAAPTQVWEYPELKVFHDHYRPTSCQAPTQAPDSP